MCGACAFLANHHRVRNGAMMSWTAVRPCGGVTLRTVEASTPASNDSTSTASTDMSPTSDSEPDWSLLPADLVAVVVFQGGSDPTMARAMAQTCVAWRDAVYNDMPTLRSLRFQGLSRSTRSTAMSLPPTATTATVAAAAATALPALVRTASKAGNVSASMAAARYLYKMGQVEDALREFSRAARLGHAEAQWKVGSALYRGNAGMGVDSEEAAMWLSRASKTLMDSSSADAMLPPVPLRRIALRECAHILGILNLDGDTGVAQDLQASVRWLRIADSCGCIDAGRMLQSLFRSGQY